MGFGSFRIANISQTHRCVAVRFCFCDQIIKSRRQRNNLRTLFGGLYVSSMCEIYTGGGRKNPHLEDFVSLSRRAISKALLKAG